MNNNKSLKSFKEEEDEAVVVSNPAIDETDLIVEPDYILEERNINALPYFAASDRNNKNRDHLYSATYFLPDGKEGEMTWRVSANVAYPYPGPTARLVYHALVEMLMEHVQGGGSLYDPIVFSISELCRAIGKKSDYRTRSRVKNALQSIRFTAIWCKGAFWKKGKRVNLSKGSTLFSDLRIRGEEDEKTGDKYEISYVTFSDFFLESLESRNIRPVDFAYIKHLSASSTIAVEVYMKLGVLFMGKCISKNGPRQKYVELSYDEYCSLHVVNKQERLKDAKKNLAPGHQTLLDTGFLSQPVEWLGKGKIAKNYKLRFFPGDRIYQEYKEGLNELAKKCKQLSLFTTPVLDTKENADLAKKLRALGFSSDDIFQLINNYHTTDIELQIDHCLWADKHQKPIQSKGSWIANALRKSYNPPAKYHAHKQGKELAEKKASFQKQKVERENSARLQKETEDKARDEQRLQLESILDKQPNKNEIIERVTNDIRSSLTEWEQNYYRDKTFDAKGPMHISQYYHLLEQYLN